MNTLVNLGKFKNNSGDFVISDPAYEYDEDKIYEHSIPSIMKGIWTGLVELDLSSQKIKKLYALFEKNFPTRNINDLNKLNWFESLLVGVDSGQAGIFDFNSYRKEEYAAKEVKFQDENKWYATCCDLTLSDMQGGVLSGGVVSASGFGDGLYKSYYATNDIGHVIAVKIEFS